MNMIGERRFWLIVAAFAQVTLLAAVAAFVEGIDFSHIGTVVTAELALVALLLNKDDKEGA